MPPRFCLRRYFLVDVTNLRQVRVTEQSIVVDHHLAIQRDQTFVFCDYKWIDLGQGSVRFKIGTP